MGDLSRSGHKIDQGHLRVMTYVNFVKLSPKMLHAKFQNHRSSGSFQFRKIITRYKRIGYNLNVMRQSACLVFNPIMVDNYAAFFNCTPVGRASDSMMAPT